MQPEQFNQTLPNQPERVAPRNKLIKTTKARQQISRPSSSNCIEPVQVEKQVHSTKQSMQQVLTESYKGLPGAKDS
jgi:hypothetical protein